MEYEYVDVTIGEAVNTYKDDEVEWFDEDDNTWKPFKKSHFYKDAGFPHAHLAEQPIVLISVYDDLENRTHTFGLKPYEGKYKGQEFFQYVHCKDERALLLSFLHFMNNNAPDVISGWHVYQFDIQYIITRIKNVFGENTDLFNKLSPINVVRTWRSKDMDEFNVDIAGVTILDYMDLFKWYSPNKLEKYSLDFVSKAILEKGKVDYSEYKNLRQLYFENWDLYVEYNVIDAYRVAQLEEQLGYIKLVQSLSLLCKAPMKYYNVMTQLIEGLLITYFRRSNMCAPYFYGGTQETFEAAYVKEPQKGKHEWVIDMDITSSYPTAIITMNMSPETFYGRIHNFTEDEIMYNVKHNSFPSFEMMKDNGLVKFEGKRLETFNKAIEKKLLCVAPCGSVFSTKNRGKIAEVTENVFNKRIEVKDKMNKLKRTLVDLRDDNLEKAKIKIAKYHSLQLSLKIIINAIFGITSVPYSRYFNINIAEGIVSCGRQNIKAGEKYTNRLLNEPNKELKEILDKMKNEIGKM